VAEAIVWDQIRMTMVFEIRHGTSVDEIRALQARINTACEFEDTDAPTTRYPVHTSLWTSGRRTFRDYIGSLHETGTVKTTFLARHNVAVAEWADASPDVRLREIRWHDSIFRRQTYAWQYEGQGGFGIVDTTDLTIADVMSSLRVNDLGLLVEGMNIG